MSKTTRRRPSRLDDRNGTNGRTPTGRFAKGNKAGTLKIHPLKRQLRSAVSDADYAAIVKKAVLQAKQGDDKARSFLVSYTLGRPITMDRITKIELPNLDDLDGCAKAASVVVQAVTAGTLGLAEGLRLIDMLDGVAAILETQAMETRITELETRIGGVDVEA